MTVWTNLQKVLDLLTTVYSASKPAERRHYCLSLNGVSLVINKTLELY